MRIVKAFTVVILLIGCISCENIDSYFSPLPVIPDKNYSLAEDGIRKRLVNHANATTILYSLDVDVQHSERDYSDYIEPVINDFFKRINLTGFRTNKDPVIHINFLFTSVHSVPDKRASGHHIKAAIEIRNASGVWNELYLAGRGYERVTGRLVKNTVVAAKKALNYLY